MASYRVGVTYTDNNGIINNTDMDRLTASINLTPKFFNNLLSVNANVRVHTSPIIMGANTLRASAGMEPDSSCNRPQRLSALQQLYIIRQRRYPRRS